MYVADLAVKKMVAAIRVRKGASNIAVNPSTNKVYVFNSDSDTISVIDGLHYKLEANVLVGKASISNSRESRYQHDLCRKFVFKYYFYYRWIKE